MKSLEEKIIKEGKVYPGRVLKVGAFLNHQIDIPFLKEIGREIYNLYKEEKITKVLTIESSGIAIATVVAELFNVPVLFAKKSKSKNIGDDCYFQRVISYTHGNVSDVVIEKEFLTYDDYVLIVDDFLANGCALEGLLGLCESANARVAGAAIVIEKSFQDGGARIRSKGVRVESLCKIKDMNVEGGITFE